MANSEAALLLLVDRARDDSSVIPAAVKALLAAHAQSSLSAESILSSSEPFVVLAEICVEHGCHAHVGELVDSFLRWKPVPSLLHARALLCQAQAQLYSAQQQASQRFGAASSLSRTSSSKTQPLGAQASSATATLSTAAAAAPTAAASKQDLSTACAAVIGTLVRAMDLAAEERNAHVLYNISVVLHAAARPLLLDRQWEAARAGLERAVAALTDADDPDLLWRVQLTLYVVKCLAELGKDSDARNRLETLHKLVKAYSLDIQEAAARMQLSLGIRAETLVKWKLSPVTQAQALLQVASAAAATGDQDTARTKLAEARTQLLAVPGVGNNKDLNTHTWIEARDGPVRQRALQSLVEHGRLALSLGQEDEAIASAKHVLQAGRCPAALLRAESLAVEIQLRKTAGSRSRAASDARHMAADRLGATLAQAVQLRDGAAAQETAALLWTAILPLLQAPASPAVKRPLENLCNGLAAIESTMYDLRCRAHVELAKIARSEGLLDTMDQHVALAQRLNVHGVCTSVLAQLAEISAAIRAEGHVSLDMPPSLASRVHLEMASASTKPAVARARLVQAGATFAPTVFGSAALPIQHPPGYYDSTPEARLTRWTHILSLSSLTKAANISLSESAVWAMVDLARTAHKKHVWDVCRAAADIALCTLEQPGLLASSSMSMTAPLSAPPSASAAAATTATNFARTSSSAAPSIAPSSNRGTPTSSRRHKSKSHDDSAAAAAAIDPDQHFARAAAELWALRAEACVQLLKRDDFSASDPPTIPAAAPPAVAPGAAAGVGIDITSVAPTPIPVAPTPAAAPQANSSPGRAPALRPGLQVPGASSITTSAVASTPAPALVPTSAAQQQSEASVAHVAASTAAEPSPGVASTSHSPLKSDQTSSNDDAAPGDAVRTESKNTNAEKSPATCEPELVPLVQSFCLETLRAFANAVRAARDLNEPVSALSAALLFWNYVLARRDIEAAFSLPAPPALAPPSGPGSTTSHASTSAPPVPHAAAVALAAPYLARFSAHMFNAPLVETLASITDSLADLFRRSDGLEKKGSAVYGRLVLALSAHTYARARHIKLEDDVAQLEDRPKNVKKPSKTDVLPVDKVGPAINELVRVVETLDHAVSFAGASNYPLVQLLVAARVSIAVFLGSSKCSDAAFRDPRSRTLLALEQLCVLGNTAPSTAKGAPALPTVTECVLGLEHLAIAAGLVPLPPQATNAPASALQSTRSAPASARAKPIPASASLAGPGTGPAPAAAGSGGASAQGGSASPLPPSAANLSTNALAPGAPAALPSANAAASTATVAASAATVVAAAMGPAPASNATGPAPGPATGASSAAPVSGAVGASAVTMSPVPSVATVTLPLPPSACPRWLVLRGWNRLSSLCLARGDHIAAAAHATRVLNLLQSSAALQQANQTKRGPGPARTEEESIEIHAAHIMLGICGTHEASQLPPATDRAGRAHREQVLIEAMSHFVVASTVAFEAALLPCVAAAAAHFWNAAVKITLNKTALIESLEKVTWHLGILAEKTEAHLKLRQGLYELLCECCNEAGHSEAGLRVVDHAFKHMAERHARHLTGYRLLFRAQKGLGVALDLLRLSERDPGQRAAVLHTLAATEKDTTKRCGLLTQALDLLVTAAPAPAPAPLSSLHLASACAFMLARAALKGEHAIDVSLQGLASLKGLLLKTLGQGANTAENGATGVQLDLLSPTATTVPSPVKSAGPDGEEGTHSTAPVSDLLVTFELLARTCAFRALLLLHGHSQPDACRAELLCAAAIYGQILSSSPSIAPDAMLCSVRDWLVYDTPPSPRIAAAFSQPLEVAHYALQVSSLLISMELPGPVLPVLHFLRALLPSYTPLQLLVSHRLAACLVQCGRGDRAVQELANADQPIGAASLPAARMHHAMLFDDPANTEFAATLSAPSLWVGVADERMALGRIAGVDAALAAAVDLRAELAPSLSLGRIRLAQARLAALQGQLSSALTLLRGALETCSTWEDWSAAIPALLAVAVGGYGSEHAMLPGPEPDAQGASCERSAEAFVPTNAALSQRSQAMAALQILQAIEAKLLVEKSAMATHTAARSVCWRAVLALRFSPADASPVAAAIETVLASGTVFAGDRVRLGHQLARCRAAAAAAAATGLTDPAGFLSYCALATTALDAASRSVRAAADVLGSFPGGVSAAGLARPRLSCVVDLLLVQVCIDTYSARIRRDTFERSGRSPDAMLGEYIAAVDENADVLKWREESATCAATASAVLEELADHVLRRPDLIDLRIRVAAARARLAWLMAKQLLGTSETDPWDAARSASTLNVKRADGPAGSPLSSAPRTTDKTAERLPSEHQAVAGPAQDAISDLVQRPDLLLLQRTTLTACCQHTVDALGPVSASAAAPLLALGQAVAVLPWLGQALMPADFDPATVTLLSLYRLAAAQLDGCDPLAGFQAQVGLPETFAKLHRHSALFARCAIGPSFLDQTRQPSSAARVFLLSSTRLDTTTHVYGCYLGGPAPSLRRVTLETAALDNVLAMCKTSPDAALPVINHLLSPLFAALPPLSLPEQHVIVLADPELQPLPLEALVPLASSAVLSVSRDFSFQLLLSRLADQAPPAAAAGEQRAATRAPTTDGKSKDKDKGKASESGTVDATKIVVATNLTHSSTDPSSDLLPLLAEAAGRKAWLMMPHASEADLAHAAHSASAMLLFDTGGAMAQLAASLTHTRALAFVAAFDQTAHAPGTWATAAARLSLLGVGAVLVNRAEMPAEQAQARLRAAAEALGLLAGPGQRGIAVGPRTRLFAQPASGDDGKGKARAEALVPTSGGDQLLTVVFGLPWLSVRS